MDESTTLKILELKYQQQKIISKNLEQKITKYENANNIVKNTIAQQDIDDLKTDLHTAEIEKQILCSQIEAIKE
jgi:hypothetical protein